MVDTTLRDQRKSITITTRVPANLKQRWQQAATMRGLTLTDFMITALNTATSDVFEEENKIELSARDQMRLAEMLIRPPRINISLAAAIQEQLEQMKES
jgi:uncharacterized protein (DUF1778 family)